MIDGLFLIGSAYLFVVFALIVGGIILVSSLINKNSPKQERKPYSDVPPPEDGEDAYFRIVPISELKKKKRQPSPVVVPTEEPQFTAKDWLVNTSEYISEQINDCVNGGKGDSFTIPARLVEGVSGSDAAIYLMESFNEIEEAYEDENGNVIVNLRT